MADERTTAVVQRYLDELAGASDEAPAEPIIRALLSGSAERLHLLCATLLRRNYQRLTRPPLNLEVEEMLSGVVERMMKAMRVVRPGTVRQFFALANQHMRWELNDLARRLDEKAPAEELHDSVVGVSPATSRGTSQISPNTARMMAAIEGLPDDERETFCLVRVQGMTQEGAADVLGVAVRTVQRRLNRSLLLLGEKLHDLQPDPMHGG